MIILKQQFSILLILLLSISCASNRNPQGGPVDQSPPVSIKNDISTLEFKSKKFEIEFDEYIQFNNPSQDIKIYPGKFNFRAKINKKKLIIETDSNFEPNTTYTLNISNIKDINEGNISQFSKTFSTGSFLDTGIIKVNIPKAEQFKNLKLSLLSSAASDSLRSFNSIVDLEIRNQINQINGLNKNKTYSLWLYTDENEDNLPDWYKPINFSNDIKADTTLILDPENWEAPFKIRKITTDGQSAKIYYNHSIHYHYELKNLVGKELQNYYYYNEDSAMLPINFLNIPFKNIDTISRIDVTKELSGIILKNMNIIEGKNKYLIYYDLPQSFQEKREFSKLTRNLFTVSSIPDSFFIDNNSKTKTILIKTKNLSTTPSNKLGYLNINIKSSVEEVYDIKIIKDGKDYLLITDHITYDALLPPGNYKVEIYERSYTHPFDPFSMRKRSRMIYSKQFDLRASWEEIMNVNLQ